MVRALQESVEECEEENGLKPTIEIAERMDTIDLEARKLYIGPSFLEVEPKK